MNYGAEGWGWLVRIGILHAAYIEPALAVALTFTA